LVFRVMVFLLPMLCRVKIRNRVGLIEICPQKLRVC
jgi:hypothetical protein